MKIRKNRGAMSGWTNVEANTQLDIRYDIDKATEIEDILEIIRSIQLKVGSIDGVSDILDQHIADPNNPHNINILISDIDIYEVLYAAYVEMYGPDITQTEFNDAFNFLRRFVTEYDVDHHTNLTSTLNLHIAEYLINKHDTDPDAHLNLKQRWFPGLPIISPPSLAVEPVMEFEYTSTRYTDLNVFDVYGNIKVIPPFKISTSYFNGVPTLPIFGSRTNFIRNSRKPAVTLHNCQDSSSDTSINVVSPSMDKEMYVIRESNVNLDAVEIEMNLNSVGVSPSNKQYVYSVGYFPIYSKYANIELINADGSKDTVKFNLVTKDVAWDGTIYHNRKALINDLGNGWYILIVSIDVEDSLSILQTISIKPCDPPTNVEDFGTTITTKSAGRLDCALWQHQFEEGTMPSTPIFTTTLASTKPADKVSIPFDKFNPTNGSMSVRVLTPNALNDIYGNGIFPLFSFHNSSSNALACHSSIVDDIIEIKSLNKNNNAMETLSSGHYGSASHYALQSVFSYTDGLHTYGFTHVEPEVKAINSSASLPDDVDENPLIARLTDQMYQEPANTIQSNVNTLFLGYNPLYNKYLDSYLIDFLYYPLFSSRANIGYLLQEHFE